MFFYFTKIHAYFLRKILARIAFPIFSNFPTINTYVDYRNVYSFTEPA